ARASPSGPDQAAGVDRAAVGRPAPVPVTRPDPGQRAGGTAAAGDHAALRRRAGRPARGTRRDSPARPRATPGDSPARGGSAGPAIWPLVGRDAELRTLHAAWREVGQAGRAVAVVGETGCGKSRLVEE